MKKFGALMGMALLILVLLSFSGCDGILDFDDTGAVKGTVTDSFSGEPLAGVTVQIGATTDTTEEDGKYQLTEIAPGKQKIQATKTGYLNYTGDVEVKEDTSVTHDIQLLEAEPGSDAAKNVLGYMAAQGEGILDYAQNFEDEEYFEAIAEAYLEEIKNYGLFAMAHVELLSVFTYAEELEPGVYYFEGNPDWGYDLIGEEPDPETENWVFITNDFMQFTIELDEDFFPENGIESDDFDITEPTFEVEIETIHDEFPEWWLHEFFSFILTEEELEEFNKDETNYTGQVEIIGEIFEEEPTLEEVTLNIEGSDSFLDYITINGHFEAAEFKFEWTDEGDFKEDIVHIDIKFLGEIISPNLEIYGDLEFYFFQNYTETIDEESEERKMKTEVVIETASITLDNPLVYLDGGLALNLKTYDRVLYEIDTWNVLEEEFGLWPILVQVNGELKVFDPEASDFIHLEGDLNLSLDDTQFDPDKPFADDNLPHLDICEFFGYLAVPGIDSFSGSITLDEAEFYFNEGWNTAEPEKLVIYFSSEIGPEEFEGNFSFDQDIAEETESFTATLEFVAGNIPGYTMDLNVDYGPELGENDIDGVEVSGGIFDDEDNMIGEFFVEEDGEEYWLKIEWDDGEIHTLFPL